MTSGSLLAIGRHFAGRPCFAPRPAHGILAKMSDAQGEIGLRAQIAARLDVAILAAREAGRGTLRYFQCDNYRVDRKADDSPVTVADRETEQLLRAQISAAFPHDPIVGEEFGETAGGSPFRWILDPIDGTKSFISGVPLYGTLVGVEHAGQSVLGVIYIPALEECAWAATGQGAWYAKGSSAPRRAAVSNKPTLAEGLFLTSQVSSFRDTGRQRAFERLESAARICRTWGDCYGYLLVATGRAEAMVDPIMNVWDAAALAPILEEAGGTFTDWQGRPTIHAGEGIGTNGRVLAEVLAMTRAETSQ
jgi:histidinol phosphatase-like enzyme (inositol monophosphatase family)